MENLLALLDKIQQISPLPLLHQETIIVHNAGMQHWLNLSLAKKRGISMNFDYALPSQYLWKLVRSLASGGDVPQQSPYSREVLTWRIDALLASKKIKNDDIFCSINHYWQDSASTTLAKNSKNEENIHYSDQALLKRYQLAEQLADLYEQYLIFRPQWLDSWQHQQVSEEFTEVNDTTQKLLQWQAKLWQLLTAEIPYNPKTLISSAIKNIAQQKDLLPPRLTFFGLNSMAPIWLELISALSEHIDVHFFHLNPCFDYWGDIVNEKQAIKMMQTWVSDDQNNELSALIGNPLLANFGQQGREFLALLQQYSTINIDAFEHAGVEIANADVEHANSCLEHIQNDILTLHDARLQKNTLIDDSISIVSCHSALREVQALHDYLLHQFNGDSSLTPKDVLVMCPQVENYAPYVDAVFSRGWQDVGEKIPPLPCSIADRVSKDSEPLVAAFIDLLQLPDSRFQVTKLIALLRLPAMQLKFALTLEEIDKLSHWLEQAAIHWGLNQQHKQNVLQLTAANNNFTWQQGLSRLLLGFAYGDEDAIYQEQLLLADIEGNDALLLGKLMQIIDQLQQFTEQMSSTKSVEAWFAFLTDVLEQLFVNDGDAAFELINNALTALFEHCQEANYCADISLVIVREFLQNHFSQPDPGKQFLVGQVTFCSMLPMRSIPFKVIAILGLNDGEFPRQRQPLGFDLMAMTPAQIGDRSRRGDDRYLFLEAIICARKSLYLSYQGRNIRNNNELQPSLVLKELMEYLDLAYGWSLLQNNPEFEQREVDAQMPMAKIHQQPMQAFSLRNYIANAQKTDSEHNIVTKWPSFDAKWLTMACQAKHRPVAEPTLILPAVANSSEIIEISLEQLVSYFTHPSKYFAKQQLNLHFEHYQVDLSDSEPFSSDPLATYQFKQALLFAQLSDDEEQINQVQKHAELGGKFPDSPLTAEEFAKWQKDSQQLALSIKTASSQQQITPEVMTFVLPLSISGKTIHISAQLPVLAEQCLYFKSSSAKPKDLLTLYLSRLFCLSYQHKMAENEQNHSLSSDQYLISQVTKSIGWYFDTKKQQVLTQSYNEIGAPLEKLTQFIQYFISGQQQALLLNIDIGERYFNARRFEQTDFESYWHEGNAYNPLASDPYIQFFWRQCPNLTEISGDLVNLYQPLFEALNTEKIPMLTSEEMNKGKA